MLEPKKSEPITTFEVIFPLDVNHYGTLFGGRLLAWMDKVAYFTAVQYSGFTSVTASVEGIDFEVPLISGDMIQLEGKVIYTGKSSMVIKVDVIKNDLFKHQNKILAYTGYFTFVALNEEKKPQPVPPMLLETEEEKKYHIIGADIKQQAVQRRRHRS